MQFTLNKKVESLHFWTKVLGIGYNSSYNDFISQKLTRESTVHVDSIDGTLDFYYIVIQFIENHNDVIPY